MPFREKARSLFKTKSRGSSLSKTSTKDSASSSPPNGYATWPSNVYKPGEPMPRPKYRAIPKKEHKEKLEAFNFADSWRKKSFQSTYSPMGTRAPSRRTSFLSMDKKSGLSTDASRNASVASTGTEKSAMAGAGRQREAHGAAIATRLSTEVEQEGDDDVGNVGLSRVPSRERQAVPRPRTVEDRQSDHLANGLHPTLSTAHDHQPFSEHDLALAIQRTRIEVPA